MKFFGLGCGSNKKQVIDSNDKRQRYNLKPNVKPPKASVLAPAFMTKEITQQDQTCEICKF
jgi:alcohol dehydrogenase YqhD (iron-dependent ADH family)